MSKKNTLGTESENKHKGDSHRSSTCNSAKSKSSLSTHLSNAEDTRTELVLTSNSNSHLNIATETLTNERSYDTSCSSLEEDLYGTSEKFNQNLNSIKEKLQELKLRSYERCNLNQWSSRSCTSGSDNTYSFISVNNSSDSDKPKGYLSSRETIFNFNEFLINEKYKTEGPTTSRDNLYYSNLPLAPTDEAPELEVIQEVDEVDSDILLQYEVPNKKLCLRDFTPKFENCNKFLQTSDSDLNRGDYSGSADATKTLHKNVSSSSSTKSSKPSTSKTLVSNISAFENDSSSLEEYKYANFVIQDDDNFNATTSRQTNTEEKKCTNYSSSSNVSINSHSKSNANFITKNFFRIIEKMERASFKSESPENVNNNEIDEAYDLRINLPSSIADDSSSYKKTPIEANITVIKKFEGKRRKKNLKNKVGPDCDLEETTNFSSCSSSTSNVNETTLLYRRYCKATPEILSRTNSSPSCIISSLSNRSYSAKSKSDTQHKTKLSQQSSASPSLTLTQNNLRKHDIIDSSLIASMDVLKIGQQNYDFPSITKITISPEKFTNEACEGDVESDNSESEKSDYKFSQGQVYYSLYTDKAKMLINSPTISPVNRIEIETRNDHGHGDLKPANREFVKCTHFKKNPIRKVQSTELSFYKLPSDCDSSEDLANKCIKVDTAQRPILRDATVEKKCKSCCCFIFFSNRNRRFFN